MLSILFACIFLTVEILLNRYLVDWYLDNFLKNKKVSYTIFNVARSPNLALVKGTYCSAIKASTTLHCINYSVWSNVLLSVPYSEFLWGTGFLSLVTPEAPLPWWGLTSGKLWILRRSRTLETALPGWNLHQIDFSIIAHKFYSRQLGDARTQS